MIFSPHFPLAITVSDCAETSSNFSFSITDSNSTEISSKLSLSVVSLDCVKFSSSTIISDCAEVPKSSFSISVSDCTEIPPISSFCSSITTHSTADTDIKFNIIPIDNPIAIIFFGLITLHPFCAQYYLLFFTVLNKISHSTHIFLGCTNIPLIIRYSGINTLRIRCR